MKGEVVGANGHVNPEASVSRTIDRRRRRAARTMVGLALVSSVVMTYTPIDTAFAATTFTVNSTVDAVDTNPGDGACSTGAGSCSLRAAIQEANALSGPDTVNVTAGVYPLAIFGAAEDLAGTGDLDITGPLTIVGAGAGSTIIDAVGNDRVLHLTETAGNVSISGVTLRGGLTAEDGGGIYRVSGDTLTLNAVTVTGNSSTSDGGGIHNATGSLVVTGGSIISGNSARNGGGVYNGGALSLTGVPSNATISGSSITGNTAVEGGGGGVWNDHEGSLTLTDVTVTGNSANDNGGGISSVSKSSLTISGGTVSNNTAHGEGGGVSTATERGVQISGTTFTGNQAGVADVGVAGEGGGGAFSSGGGNVDISGATFSGNSAPGEGGAIYLDNLGSVAITDSVIATTNQAPEAAASRTPPLG